MGTVRLFSLVDIAPGVLELGADGFQVLFRVEMGFFDVIE